MQNLQDHGTSSKPRVIRKPQKIHPDMKKYCPHETPESMTESYVSDSSSVRHYNEESSSRYAASTNAVSRHRNITTTQSRKEIKNNNLPPNKNLTLSESNNKHPSWIAKQAQKVREAQRLASIESRPCGKKVIFSDD